MMNNIRLYRCILTILIPFHVSLFASPSEPERYDPVEYFNQDANTY